MEELLFDVSDDATLYNIKQDLMFQIGKFDINIAVKGLFIIDGKFVVTVSASLLEIH